MRARAILFVALFAGLAITASGQPAPNTTSSMAPGPPIRILGPAIAATTIQLTNPSQIRALPGGRVLVNDGSRRRLLLLDSTMSLIKVVADSVSTFASAYGVNIGKLLPYRGDSSLLLDSQTLSMLVIDGDGNIVKVKAVPRTEHVTYLASSLPTYGNPGFDTQGRLIYRIADPSVSLSLMLGGGVLAPQQPDSAPVLRMNLETRQLDTAGKVKIQKRSTIVTQTATGGISMRSSPANPMPTGDDWAVTSDGTLALLRHRDYSIDWLRPDGKWESTQPMPFDWQRLTDDHKKAFVDSMRTQLENSRKMTLARYDSINHVCFNMERTMGPPVAKEVRDAIVEGRLNGRAAVPGTAIVGGRAAATGRGAPPPPPGGRAAQAASSTPGANPAMVSSCPPEAYPPPALMYPTPVSVIDYKELPDYKPPFSSGALRADGDGNLWIRVNQMKPVPGAYIFDVANQQGELIDRIQIPIARSVVGFGPGNIVYTLAREGTTVKLERVRWARQ